ncbi:LPXTG cell wall anchor domain-containing protein [Bacillus sp. B2-WWTP-C-10-Post-4]|uniref:LPXTG cell wall anchor domain-containing protein n=1 Tax=Bacillus sp. B2-WWTP-C-10-Post-4 TaxID=2653218 RepID=UPI0012621406|nr:LPXTG cell wall anchor domain-containing protein [Bacillus sp. B2-WWTP-C-10-Post-4]KAB7658806.1 LPXTG cell wall anchor domain-containing protein [Bacillus sp. B2-WWTP-C-10-Post-4]
MTKIFILASTLSLSFFSGLNIGNAATENFQPLTNAIVQNSDHFAEGNSKDNNKPPGNNGSQDDSGSGGSGSHGGNGSQGGNRVKGDSSSQGGNGSQGNRVKGDSSSQGGNGSQGNRVKGDSNSEEGKGSQGDNVKDNTKKQGDKLPNTATHYPISILMGLSTFLIGMLLFIRRKNVK